MSDMSAQPSPSAPLPATPNFQQTSQAAVQPAFADAGQTADNQKMALLQAIASAGAAGKQQFLNMASQNASDKQAAINAAASREAVVQNMPPALAAQLGAQISKPFDFGAAQNTSAQGTLANDMTAQQGAAGNYLTELKASIPVNESDTQAKIAALQANAYKTALTDQLNLTDAANRAKASEAAANAKTASTTNSDGTDTVSAYLKSTGGSSTASSALFNSLQGQFGGLDPGTLLGLLTGDKQSQDSSGLTNTLNTIAKQENLQPSDALSLMIQGARAAQSSNTKQTGSALTNTGKQLSNQSKEYASVANTTDPQTWTNILTAIQTLTGQGASYNAIYGKLTAAGATAAQANAAIAAYQKGEKANQALGGG